MKYINYFVLVINLLLMVGCSTIKQHKTPINEYTTINTDPGLGNVSIDGIIYELPITLPNNLIHAKQLLFKKTGYTNREVLVVFDGLSTIAISQDCEENFTVYPPDVKHPRGLIIPLKRKIN